MSSSSSAGSEGQQGPYPTGAAQAAAKKRKRHTDQELEQMGFITDLQMLDSVVGDPTYLGIEHAAQGGLAPLKVTEIDWDESQLREHVKWRKFSLIMRAEKNYRCVPPEYGHYVC